jgi:sigma-B regulation protein RsbU (phosphoserine phosphatase)
MNILPRNWLRRLAARGLLPRSAFARVTAYLAALYAALLIVRGLLALGGSARAAGSLSVWVTGLGFAVVVLLFVFLVRWVRRRLLWRLRNRLVVTYVFIAVIPVALLLLMALLAGYFFVGQFATFLATSDLQAELATVKASNDEVAAQVAAQLNAGVAPERVADSVRSAELADRGAARSVSFWIGERRFIVRPGSEPRSEPEALPRWLEKELVASAEFRSFLISEGRPRLFAARELRTGSRRVVVASSVPLTSAMLARLARDLGVITIYGSRGGTPETAQNPARSSPVDREIEAPLVSAGSLPPGSWWDGEVSLVADLPAREWPAGTGVTLETLVRSRKSLLYRRLVATLGERFSSAPLIALSLAGMAFAIIELLALWIGIRLTRTMTSAVAQLYSATQHINRGDFSHRIAVRSNDQLAALEGAFNSMTANIERLLAEQQEKQRIENELSIAQEVQNQLFPRHAAQLPTLEVYGVCRPARTVSGDYYDFLPLGHNRLAIALGDISGKGISAALLMATLHSAVRSFVMLPEQVVVGAIPAMAAAGSGKARPVNPESDAAQTSPARWLTLLNRHLYASTAPEKYATLFLAIYDGPARRLTYCNGGHLPPVVLGRDGSTYRLEAGGMAIGLFDGMTYDQAGVSLAPGDIFVAYSDGITEPENEFGEFGEQRLLELIRENSGLSLERIAEEVKAAVSDWIGSAEQPDDMTLVLARVR